MLRTVDPRMRRKWSKPIILMLSYRNCRIACGICMADPSKFRLSNWPEKPICAVQDNSYTRPRRTKDHCHADLHHLFLPAQEGLHLEPRRRPERPLCGGRARKHDAYVTSN